MRLEVSIFDLLAQLLHPSKRLLPVDSDQSISLCHIHKHKLNHPLPKLLLTCVLKKLLLL